MPPKAPVKVCELAWRIARALVRATAPKRAKAAVNFIVATV